MSTESRRVFGFVPKDFSIDEGKFLASRVSRARQLPQCHWTASVIGQPTTISNSRTGLLFTLTTPDGIIHQLDDPHDHDGTYTRTDRYLERIKIQKELIIKLPTHLKATDDESKLGSLKLVMKEALRIDWGELGGELRLAQQPDDTNSGRGTFQFIHQGLEGPEQPRKQTQTVLNSVEVKSAAKGIPNSMITGASPRPAGRRALQRVPSIRPEIY
ncbi:hypothetical protein QBC43DRAFT_358239 [Cladorrhinum sp. PSN259]|nr:hypothetical protein QBC43DRAFT_358239 [Cladorrhinum sp. PSN259]